MLAKNLINYNAMNTDCIHFEEVHWQNPEFRCCSYSGGLYKIGVDDNTMCQHCRLWDAYIPQSATTAEKEKAFEWQQMSLEEQLANPYEEYFGL